MTDRVSSLTVILERDLRVDDAEAIRSAISLMAQVADVQFGPVVNVNDAFERARVRRELVGKLMDLIRQ